MFAISITMRFRKTASNFVRKYAAPVAAGILTGTALNTSKMAGKIIKKNYQSGPKRVIRLGSKGARMGTIKGNPTGIATLSRCFVNHKPSRTFTALRKVGITNAVVDQKTLRTDAASGFQEYGSLAHLNNTDMLTILNQLPGGAASVQNTRYAVKNYQADVLFSNNANMSCELEIYDVVCKRSFSTTQANYDTNTSTQLPWGADPLGPVVGAIKWGINMGTLAVPGPSTPPYNYQLIGSSMYDSPIFKDFFTVKKRTLVKLPQGGVHRHVFTQRVNRVVDKSLLATQYNVGSSVIPAAWAGLTYFTLWKTRGYPVSDKAGTNITIAQSSIDCVQSRRWTYTYTQDIAQGLSYSDYLVSLAPGAEAFVNPGSGAIDVVQTTT